MKPYAIYLRKSREDIEAEAHGEGETLARHRRALLDFAQRNGMDVVRVYEEIVSGDSIDDRPQMRALLASVERGEYAGVIVNDVDRLGRGDSIDQGIIKRAFYFTSTLIITPNKTIDPQSTADEDYFDISMFFARYEYKISNRRLQTGRSRSAAEGNYLGTRVPFGYVKVKRPDRTGWTLEPHPEFADIVRSIFKWYAYDGIGSDTIANRLNDMGLRTYLGSPFYGGSVRLILQNPNYIGTTSWNKRVKSKKIVDGKVSKGRIKNDSPIIVENAHPAIVDRELWDAVQRSFATHAKLPKSKNKPVANVLAGLIYCSHCGCALQRKPGVDGRPDVLHCKTYNCPTTGIYISTLETTILETLSTWQQLYGSPKRKVSPAEVDDAPVRAIERQIVTIDKQLDSLHDLLEQGIYSAVDFIRRRDELQSRRSAITAQLESLKNTPSTEDVIRAELPQIKYVLESYHHAGDLETKNKLLRSVIAKVVYEKTHRCFRNENPADFLTINVFPRQGIF